MVVLIVGAALLWRPGETPILLLLFFVQWAQTSIGIFHANILGEDISAYTLVAGSIRLATELSLASLMILAIGLRIGAGAPNISRATAVTECPVVPVRARKWLIFYICTSAFSFLALYLVKFSSGLSEPMLALASLKWVSFFMLANATFVNSRGLRFYFFAAFVFELVQGLGGFFSDFKTVFIVTILARAGRTIRLSLRMTVTLCSVAVILVGLSVVWTAVKLDFRSYVSSGTHEQVINIDFSTRLGALADLAGSLDSEKLGIAADNFVRRISYVSVFGLVLDVVPQWIPHADGAIWIDAVTRPFKPRLLFPDKSSISDIERTNYYTDGFVEISQGTSISIGYVGESYIDFGIPGMMVPIFAYGLLCGTIYRLLLNLRGSSRMLGMALVTAVFIRVIFLESSITKTFSEIILSSLVAWGFVKFVVPTWFPWLRVEQ
jgi:hypothetical protein